MPYYVYILSNRFHRTVFYAGATGDLRGRLEQHRHGQGGRFTSTYRTHDLLYAEPFDHPSDAIECEKTIKGWRCEKKLDLIRSVDPELADLSHSLL